jgi:hypothetical protein
MEKQTADVFGQQKNKQVTREGSGAGTAGDWLGAAVGREATHRR